MTTISWYCIEIHTWIGVLTDLALKWFPVVGCKVGGRFNLLLDLEPWSQALEVNVSNGSSAFAWWKQRILLIYVGYPAETTSFKLFLSNRFVNLHNWLYFLVLLKLIFWAFNYLILFGLVFDVLHHFLLLWFQLVFYLLYGKLDSAHFQYVALLNVVLLHNMLKRE